MTYTLDWSETDLGGTAVVSYGSGAILDFTDKPSGATSALSITSNQSDGVDNILAEFSIVTTGSSVMTFDYKVSTESGWDKFHIDVDGVSQANYSGIVAWTSHTGINIPSAGTHTIRFRYTKDGGGAVNADRVWVALLNITNTTTVNDSSGTVDTYDFEDGATPSFITTSTWTNSTSAPITGTRSMRSPASPANSGTYDLEIDKAAGSDWAAVGFDFKVSTEAGWDKLFLFPDATASNVPATGSPSAAGESGWLDWSGTTSGRIAVILPAAASSLLLRYTKDGGGSAGSDAVWIDTLKMPATGGGGTTVEGTASLTGDGSLTATGVRTVVGSASATGDGELATTGQRTIVSTAALTGDGTLTAAGQRSTSGSAALTGDGTLTATGQRTTTGTATFTGDGTLTGIGDGSTPANTITGSASLTGNGSLTTTGTRTVVGTTALVGNGTLSTLGTRTIIGSTALAGLGQITVTGQRLTFGTAALVGTGTLTGTDASYEAPLPPASRTLIVPAETRVLVVAAETRTLTIPAESRTITA